MLRCDPEGAGGVACDRSGQLLSDDRGEPLGFVRWVRDRPRGRDGQQELDPSRSFEALLKAIHDRLPMVVWRIDRQGIFTYHDGMGLAAAGLKPGQHLGKSVFELYPQDQASFIRRALAGETVSSTSEAHGIVWESWVVPLEDVSGAVAGALGWSLDVTVLHRAERELRAKLELLERQQRTIRALSTPILQVWNRVLALPMVGVVDSARTAEVMENLLQEVARTQARFAILDLTGVDTVDTKTAAYLIEIVRAIALLGARGIITGIRPSVAQTIVGLGVDLAGVLTLANLQAGLQHCIAAMQRDVPSASTQSLQTGGAPRAAQ